MTGPVSSPPDRRALRCAGLVLALTLALCALLPTPEARTETVRFMSLDGETRLHAILRRPANGPVRGGIVMLHGCSGLFARGGGLKARDAAWVALLRDMGLVVLAIDSAGPRGIATSCGRPEPRRRLYRARPFDAYAGLAFLQRLPAVPAARVALLGFSQGGGIVLLSADARSIGRPTPPPRPGFAAAIAFYPAACREDLQSTPYTTVTPGTWRPTMPLLVLMGEADDWTPAAPCRAFIAAAAARGAPAAFQGFAGAHHGFDGPGATIRPLRHIRKADGSHPHVGGDPAARAEARQLVRRFLERHLLGG